MTMLADRIDFVLGVDTHKHTHTAAAVTPAGGLVAHLTVAADAAGYRRLLAFADELAPGRRIWAIEGTGSFGAGLTTYLLEHAEWVVEIDRPKRPARRNGAKTDQLDAVRAAREALAREHLAQPRRRGAREALRVLLTTRENAMRARTKAICQLKDLVVSAPESLRRPLHGLPTAPWWIAALACGRIQRIQLSSGTRSWRCKPRRAEPSRWRPRPRSWKPSLSRSPGSRRRSCSTRSASVRSAPRNSSAPGRTPVACGRRPPSRRWPAWRQSPLLQARLRAID